MVFEKLDLDYKEYLRIDPRYFRPNEVDVLLGDATKAKKKLGWEPRVRFDELLNMMIEADMMVAKREKTLLDAGHMLYNR